MTGVLPILADAEIARISAIGARIQSEHDGEVLNASRMLVRCLDKHGLRIADVLTRALKPHPRQRAETGYRSKTASPLRDHQRQARECLGLPDGVITKWEEEFITSVLHRPSITPRQAEILTGIVAKVRRHVASSRGAF